MTAFIEEVRELIYFEKHAFNDIYDCLNYYYNKYINPKEIFNVTKNKFNITNNAWDFKQIEKEKDVDAFQKILRMLANFMTI